MNKWPIILAIAGWILLFWIVYAVGGWVLDAQQKSAKKKWGTEERDYAHEKWTFRFYVIAFFVGIPLLLGIALYQEYVPVMVLIENYTILSSCLVILYLLLYVGFVKNVFHYMYGRIRLYKILFGVFSALMYIVVTMISLNA